jgi:hypothetical protein
VVVLLCSTSYSQVHHFLGKQWSQSKGGTCRWANEHLLRTLAGPMTAQDMVSLFNPVPFGEFRETALQLVLAHAPHRWEKLRNIDMDKQDALLEV